MTRRADLPRHIEIRGRVLHADDGTPVAGADVVVSRVGPGHRERRRRVLTAADGTFSARVWFDPRAWRGFAAIEVSTPGLERVRVNCLVPSAPAVSYTLRLRRAITVRGHVRRTRGTRWGRLTVHAADVRGYFAAAHPHNVFTEWVGNGEDVTGGVRWTARVAADGSFRVDGVPEGVDLVAEVVSDRHTALHPIVHIDAATAAEQRVDIAVALFDRVVVRVLDDQGAPVRSACVVSAHDEQRTTRHGRATLCVGDTDSVTASKRGFFGVAIDAPVPRDEENVLVLDRGAPLRVRVTDATGTPVRECALMIERDVRLEMEGSDGVDFDAEEWRRMTDEDGWASFVRVPTRHAALGISSRRFPVHHVSIESVHDGATVRLAGWAAPWLRVVVPGGSRAPEALWTRFRRRVVPADRAWLSLSPESSAEPVPIESDTLRIPWVVAGRSRVTCWADGYDEASVEIEVPEGFQDYAGAIELVPASDGATRPEWAHPPAWARDRG